MGSAVVLEKVPLKFLLNRVRYNSRVEDKSKQPRSQGFLLPALRSEREGG